MIEDDGSEDRADEALEPDLDEDELAMDEAIEADEADEADEGDAPAETAPADGAPAEAAPAEAAASAVSADPGAAEGAPAEAAPAEAAPMEAASADAAPAEGSGFLLEDWVLSALEALAFASTEPLQPARAREVIAAEMEAMDGMEGKTPPTSADMQLAFRLLLERWGDPLRPLGQGFRLVEVDGGLSFRTAAANARFQRRMLVGRPQRLSRAGLETLAVVAYRQPVTKPQVEEIRGVDSSGAIKALLDKKLIRVLGKAEEIGRPLLYGTTKTFLEFFGMSSLNDLPTLKELHELEHGVTEAPAEDDERPAVIMDLFNADTASAVSTATEAESAEALDALERALGEAKDVAKRASALVFGIQVEDEDAPASAAAAPPPAPLGGDDGASGTAPDPSDAAEQKGEVPEG